MRFSIFFSFLLISFCSFSQSKSKQYFSVSINPVATYSINNSNSDALAGTNPPQTYKQYADSVKAFETFKLSVGATVWYNYALNNQWTIQAGVGYSEVGFTREQTNIKFNDKLFPGIGTGKLIENSNTEKSIDYNFKYQYLSVPILFNYFAKRSKDFKWNYYLTGGVGLNMLVHHEIRAVLNQFVVEGQDAYHLDSTGYEAAPFTVNLFVGGRFDYKIDKNISVFAQPMLTVFPFSVSKTEMKVHPIGLQINLGVSFDFEAKKDE